LRTQIRLWADAEPLRALGGTPRVGFIFAGPTGTGKTTAAHALAAETGRELYSFAGPDFHRSGGLDLLTTVLATMARQRAVVFVDEADDLLHRRDFRRERSESLVKHLLVGLDRTTRDIRSFFVFATNLGPGAIDPALCHPGRLGRPIVFRGLAASERLGLLEAQAAGFRLAPGIDLRPIASQLGGVPTATLVHVLDEAAYVAARDGHAEIEAVDLQEAASRLRGGLARLRDWSPEELRGAAIHEAGHAIARIVLGGTWDAVAWVEVDARLDGSLGAVFDDDDDDFEAPTEPQIRDELVVKLAGRCAEAIVEGSADVGSASDLRSATVLALRAARERAFSRRGPMVSSAHEEEAIVEAHVVGAARELLLEAERRAAATVTRYRDALDALTERLILHRAASSDNLADWLAPYGLLPESGSGR
jgi:cell division protease FtsH